MVVLESHNVASMTKFFFSPENFIRIIGGFLTSNFLTTQIDVWLMPFILRYIWNADDFHEHTVMIKGVQIQYGQSVLALFRFVIALIIIFTVYKLVLYHQNK